MRAAYLSKLQEWNEGYSIDEAWTGAGNPLEMEILSFSERFPSPALDCVLYRGTGVLDGVPTSLTGGTYQVLEPSKRLIHSWSKDIEVARLFMNNAIETNHSAILIGIHSSRLQIVADLDTMLKHDHYGESEVIVRNLPVLLHPEDIIDAWEYDKTLEACRQLEQFNVNPSYHL